MCVRRYALHTAAGIGTCTGDIFSGASSTTDHVFDEDAVFQEWWWRNVADWTPSLKTLFVGLWCSGGRVGTWVSRPKDVSSVSNIILRPNRQFDDHMATYGPHNVTTNPVDGALFCCHCGQAPPFPVGGCPNNPIGLCE